MSIRRLLALATAAWLTLGPVAEARDTALHLPTSSVLENPEFKARLIDGVALHFGKGAPVGKGQDLGEFVANRKTNGVGKSDEQACRWAMLSALLALQERAQALGGNAVVDIRSYYKRRESWSASEFECHAGGVVVGVALKGRVVRK